ncbi:putative ferrous iron transport protein A [Gordonia hirsuta DSM 44140 = NBRC 16056]|uniref:Putative ferrous iron transport protein A n=1 Tax=Gordonia hirsuta DSM 44140 = NBRC 16056 TaxID=1121927 RepID=L7LBT2_9ACTN|nr:FeoA family protein [Gordonia hirsuta]GAC58585.1 putative ferrous iron transport protein A [Gordonia hirsuta DSM 44140 = NBRC 16056]
MTPLSRVAVGATATIRDVSDSCPEPVRRRLASLGFDDATRVRKVRRAPMGDPSVYEVMGYQICLRDREAQHIVCELADE